MAKAVISTIGHDRPGLVAELTSIARQHALNIEDSRMTVLGGEFAVLMSLEGSDGDLVAFKTSLEQQSQAGDFAYLYRPTGAAQTLDAARPYLATVVAIDHPGIVHRIAQFFSERSINIRDLHTETSPAPHTGTPIFNVSLLIDVPAQIKINELKQAFEAFCEDADLDGSLSASGTARK